MSRVSIMRNNRFFLEAQNILHQIREIRRDSGDQIPAMGFIHPLHSVLFDFNEEVMSLGAAIHTQSVVDFLIKRQCMPLTPVSEQ